MSSDHTADQPTPAGSATPRDVIANVRDTEYPQYVLGEFQADAILSALEAASYQIAEAGADYPTSTFSNPTLHDFFARGDRDGLYRFVQRALADSDRRFAQARNRIAAASEPAGGEGTE